MTASERPRPRIGIGLHEDHNAGVCAVADGEVLVYAEFERCTRRKNQAGWHPDLLDEQLAGIDWGEVGAVCAPRPEAVAEWLIERHLARRLDPRRLAVGGRELLLLDQDDRHPFLHLLSMLVLPELQPALYAVLIADAEQPRVGWVDLRAPLTAPPRVRLLPPGPDRWFNGEIYAGLFGTLFYGSNDLENCGKLMGLAGWGRSRLDYVEALRRLARAAFDGSRLTWQGYEGVRPEELRTRLAAELPVEPTRFESPGAQDLAASAQELFRYELTRAVMGGLAQVRAELARLGLPQPAALLYSGGCALSVVANGALRQGLDMPLLVAPYAHDASQFVGGAVFAALSAGEEPFPLGRGWPGLPCHTGGRITAADLATRRGGGGATDPASVAAALLQGEVLAYVEECAEAGPRALGHRSLLANALDSAMRDRINSQMKKRDWYRPLAPMLSADAFPHYFADAATPTSHYMLDTFCLRPLYRGLLAAVSSPDGLSRPQAIRAQEQPWLHALLCELGARSGHAVVLNTSLNAPGLPIAYDTTQALADCDRLGVAGIVCQGVRFPGRA